MNGSSNFSATGDLLVYLADPAHRALLLRATTATLGSSASGYVVGALVGGLLAALGHLIRPLHRGLDRLNATVHVIPVIALGPLFVLVLGQELAPMALAALTVCFTFYVAAESALSAVSKSLADLFVVLGAGRARRLWLLSAPAALPALTSGLKLAMPRALTGAILGEWFGASRGLGVLMLTGMQEARISLLWSAVLLATVISALAFAVGSLIERAAERRFR